MPTATSLSGRSLINIGPLTTTFTAPASCSTAFVTLLAAATNPALSVWGAQCDPLPLPPADCNPSGSIFRSIASSAAGSNPTDSMIIVYLAVSDAYILVHQASDVSTASIASSTAKTNAAVRVRGNKNGLGIAVTVCWLALALGSLLVV